MYLQLYVLLSTGPKPIDIEKTNELKDSLIPYGVFESEAEMHHRMEVLGALHRLVRQWIRDESARKNMPPSVAETVGGNIYTFGSYRLGVSVISIIPSLMSVLLPPLVHEISK